ncbi:MAG: DUF4091 domain-containing protein [Lachnospiraceae bacterium]|nr:DUF4091 domain-containing protein [Lachnospiraceae bacterium]MDY5742959.1 DUF4091 domain-containing protein [Lachnospiraceae bacterium]
MLDRQEIWLLHESYRHGLNQKEEFEIEQLEYDDGSFAAYQLLWEAEQDCMVRVQEGYSYTPQRLPVYAPYSEGFRFRFVEPVMTEKGRMWDRISEDIEREYQKGETVVLLATGAKLPADCTVRLSVCPAADHGQVCFSKRLPLIRRGSVPKAGKYLELWQHPATLARYYGVTPYGEEHFHILTNFLKPLAELGVGSVTVIVSDAPWDGQQKHLTNGEFIDNVFEVNMIRVVKRKPLQLDFSALDRYIDLCRGFDIGPDIDIFGLLGLWGNSRMKVWVQEDQSYLDQDELETYVGLLYEHFQSRGYDRDSFICFDEPQETELLYRQMTRFARLCPTWKLKGAFDNPLVARELAPQTDEYSTSFFLTCREEVARGSSWYICCGPQEPNTFISGSLVQIRGLAYLSHYFKLNRLLRWSAFAFGKRVRTDGRFAGFPAGDGFLLYPGRYGNAELSLRYMQLLRFKEDMAILESAGQHCQPQLEAICTIAPEKALLPEFQVIEGFISKEWRTYEQARKTLLGR